MGKLQQLRQQYENMDFRDLTSRHLEELSSGLKEVKPEEIKSSNDGKAYVDLLRKFREAVAENDKFHGQNYPKLLNSLLSVGEDGLYSNNLRFIFELIQNVDDCDYLSNNDRILDMHFDFNHNVIKLTYNEVGFTPFNVFAITGIAEAAKNVSSSKNQIGEKGIGFKSVFGVADKVLIRSGWFSFELYKDKFTIPVSAYITEEYITGTQMELYVPGKVEKIYREINNQYCNKEALFSKNPLLFLNKLTSLKMYFDVWRRMEFHVSRSTSACNDKIKIERNVEISIDLHNAENCTEKINTNMIKCTRYTYPVVFSKNACKSRYGENTKVGDPHGKEMSLIVVIPNPEYISEVGSGALYSFLPTQLKFTVPIVCHVPFKLDASREFVDPQNNNTWFKEACNYFSELLDFLYQDWKTVVRENITLYLPGIKDSIFAKNNGKEQCLSEQKNFSSRHFLTLPLFYTNDNDYHPAETIFCFDQDERLSNPQKVYEIMEYQSPLFIPKSSITQFQFKTECNINLKLFRKALSNESKTSEALNYLDSVGFEYNESLLSDQESLILTKEQIEIIFRHHALSSVLKTLACKSIQHNKRLKISIIDATEYNLSEVMFEGFDLSDTPDRVAMYMRYCDENSFCLNIGKDEFFPCFNGIVLSEQNMVSSFAAFCYNIDSNANFAIRIKLREASKNLNHIVKNETGTPSEYLKALRENRLLVKDTLGDTGYKNYIDLILNSGTDKGRFIQEILQNADDCIYAPDIQPHFLLKQNGNLIITEYNEVGFNRANIRSITAIGESTKNNIVNGQFGTIGEKGVGFKTIFAVASKVNIRSGEYAFSLTDHEPTIPRPIKSACEPTVEGTRMEVFLKETDSIPTYNDKTILELCICLRKLRHIQIENHVVKIEDTNDHRIVTIDKKKHVFKRFTHTFTVTNEEALNERRNGSRIISSEQDIICFVPEKGTNADYPLYNGLPTKHRIKIPLVIDAPFALTTSREEIETDSSRWNNIVREEMYTAILEVIDSLKNEERAKIFRFIRFVHRMQGLAHVYVNDISDCPFITEYNYLDIVRKQRLLPTFNNNIFAVPYDNTAFRFPEAANYLFSNNDPSEYAGIPPESIIDASSSDSEVTLNALGCEAASFERVFPIIKEHAEKYIKDESFRNKLYEFLQCTPNEYHHLVKQLAIIPVYGKSYRSIKYIAWKDDSIFVKSGSTVSTSDYYVLNEQLLPKSMCEKILGVNINDMNKETEKNRYNSSLKRIIQETEDDELYYYLLTEFNNKTLRRNESFDILYALREYLPLKNELGEISTSSLFLCNQPVGYFPVQMIQSMIVNKECSDFAQFIRCEELSNIHYEDIEYDDVLTADDVEILQDDYFINSEEILRGFYKDGLLPQELIDEYGLDFLTIGRQNVNDEGYEFPEVPIGNRLMIRNHVKKQWANPIKVVARIENRTVYKGENPDGSVFDLGYEDARKGALLIYTPEGATERCFCQMCHSVKPYKLIEVNNLELKPDYYFRQLRVSLCLECSKKFEMLRNNVRVRKTFIEAIMKTQIYQDQGAVDIPIGDEEVITFTAKHLAEIQEIFYAKGV